MPILVIMSILFWHRPPCFLLPFPLIFEIVVVHVGFPHRYSVGTPTNWRTACATASSLNLCISVSVELTTIVHAETSHRPLSPCAVLLSLVVVSAPWEVEHLVLRVLVLLPPEEDEAAEEGAKEDYEAEADHPNEPDQKRRVRGVGS